MELKNKYCYYHLTENEKGQLKEFQQESGFKNISSYIRAHILYYDFISEENSEPDLKIKRDEYNFRVTESQLNKIRSDSVEFNRSISEYVRLKVLKKPVGLFVNSGIKNEQKKFLRRLYGLMTLHYLETMNHKKSTKEIKNKIENHISEKLYLYNDYKEIKELSIKLKNLITKEEDTYIVLLNISKRL